MILKTGKLCPFCEINLILPSHKNCNDCDGHIRPTNELKAETRNRTRYLISKGILKRMPCEKCGNPKTEAHHPDYSKPTLIQWLCFKCHRLHHSHTTLKDIDMEERNEDIKNLQRAGETYEKIGKKYGITRQRVEQIIHLLPVEV